MASYDPPLSPRDNILKSLFIGMVPTLGFMFVAIIAINQNPDGGLAAVNPVVYAVLALLTTYLIVDGDNWLIMLTAIAAPIGFAALLPPTETNVLLAGRFFAALSICGLSYCFVRHAPDVFAGFIGLLVCVIVGGFMAAAGMTSGLNVSLTGSMLLLLLFVAVRWNGHRGYDAADEQRDREDPPDAEDYDVRHKDDDE